MVRATITGDFDEKAYPTHEVLSFKVGAQIMIVKNIYADEEEDLPIPILVNGDICTIVEVVLKDEQVDTVEVFCKRTNNYATLHKDEWTIHQNLLS